MLLLPVLKWPLELTSLSSFLSLRLSLFFFLSFSLSLSVFLSLLFLLLSIPVSLFSFFPLFLSLSLSLTHTPFSLASAVQHERVTGTSMSRPPRRTKAPSGMFPVPADSTTAMVATNQATFSVPRPSLAIPTPLTPWANWFSYQNSIASNSVSEDILNYSRLYFGVGEFN